MTVERLFQIPGDWGEFWDGTVGTIHRDNRYDWYNYNTVASTTKHLQWFK